MEIISCKIVLMVRSTLDHYGKKSWSTLALSRQRHYLFFSLVLFSSFPPFSSFPFHFVLFRKWKYIYIYIYDKMTKSEIWDKQKCLYVSWALFLKLQAAGINFEKLLGWTVFKNPNFNPFQSSSVLPICGICCFCYVIWTFL